MVAAASAAALLPDAGCAACRCVVVFLLAADVDAAAGLLPAPVLLLRIDASSLSRVLSVVAIRR